MENNDWITVRQAAYILEVSMQRVYALISAGTLSSKKQALTRMVNRRSVLTYAESPTRNKFAGGGQKALPLDGETPELPGMEDDGGALMMLVDRRNGTYDDEWSGLVAPTLSVEARRLYDDSERGQREARLRLQAVVEGGV